MILLLWFSACCLLTAVFATAITCLPTLAGAESLMPGLLKTVIDCCDGRWGVKFILSFEVSSRSYEEYSSGSAVHSRSSRVDSRMYEALRTSEGFSGEDFQNTGTLIVVRSSVFSKSSAHKTHLARDAYSASSSGA